MFADMQNETNSQTKLFACLPARISLRFTKLLTYFKRKRSSSQSNKVKEYLTSEPADTLHKPARRKYKRNKVTSLGIDYLW